MSTPIVCYDHKGRKFNTLIDMCRFWNISPSTYKYRRQCGKSVEEALTAKAYHEYNGKPVTDHEGNVFPTVRKMMQHWGIEEPELYYARKSHGWTLEERLTGIRKRRKAS